MLHYILHLFLLLTFAWDLQWFRFLEYMYNILYYFCHIWCMCICRLLAVSSTNILIVFTAYFIVSYIQLYTSKHRQSIHLNLGSPFIIWHVLFLEYGLFYLIFYIQVSIVLKMASFHFFVAEKNSFVSIQLLKVLKSHEMLFFFSDKTCSCGCSEAETCLSSHFLFVPYDC